MTDRLLPHACVIANRVIAELSLHGEQALADQLASVHRATCDMVAALHAEREAPTEALRSEARRRYNDAFRLLRTGQRA